ncbi:MAG: hypothetical protein Kow00117_05750 [Phototrophicales bacterium]|nr:MAG: hypothetical protein D6711_11010 [Chloroflexota bacterium]
MGDLERLEQIAEELIKTFEIYAPPVPIETMLRDPKNNMWETVDVNQISGTFLSIRDQYSPRMSLARLLARHVATSPWGKARGLLDILRKDEENIKAFARMLIMPREMVNSLPGSARNPLAMTHEFEVPEEDASLRLAELDSI